MDLDPALSLEAWVADVTRNPFYKPRFVHPLQSCLEIQANKYTVIHELLSGQVTVMCCSLVCL